MSERLIGMTLTGQRFNAKAKTRTARVSPRCDTCDTTIPNGATYWLVLAFNSYRVCNTCVSVGVVEPVVEEATT